MRCAGAQGRPSSSRGWWPDAQACTLTPTRLSVYEGLAGLVMPRLTRTTSLPKLAPARPHGFSAVQAAPTEPPQPAHKGSLPAGAARAAWLVALPRTRQVRYAATTESVVMLHNRGSGREATHLLWRAPAPGRWGQPGLAGWAPRWRARARWRPARARRCWAQARWQPAGADEQVMIWDVCIQCVTSCVAS